MNLPQSLHFVGIGGVGMSAVAQVCHAKGVRVSGSDAQMSATVQRLQSLGITVHIGHAAENVGPDARALVVSTAVSTENPEVAEALRRGLPIHHRSAVLGRLMAAKSSVAVTGTHGKTTTTAMLSAILLAADLDPTVLLGGDLPALGGNARHGEGPWLVAEADESDKSLVNLTAKLVIVTNLEGDHLEHYKNLDEIIEVVASFIRALPAGSLVVGCLDDAGVRDLRDRVSVPFVTYGTSSDADFPIKQVRLSSEGSTFEVAGVPYALKVGGHHNVLNATAAIVASLKMGITPIPMQRALVAFGGVKRRFQTIGTVGGVTVVDDYAHHPSEVKATLSAAALLGRPIHAVFQPHRHSRLEALLKEFSDSFGGSRSVTILNTYGAGEAPRKVDAGSLTDLVREAMPGVPVAHTPSHQAAVEHLAGQANPGDLVLLLGAGDIHLVAQPLLSRLEDRFDPAARTA
ncbi:MAG: UDP-N-acetylmuramate--L-alanine ligase [Candidatus Sericytochromatia bacterium]|nr:UDP-N-acetylmuramate--L-alanine ligase [Candidatus Sericytochromatia bacterium]